MFVSLAIVALVASVSAKDLTVGEGGELVFHENITESPTIWKRAENLTVEAPAEITRIVITDLREDKNGEATIVEGGVGTNNVTIEMKGPGVFRGLYFEVQVYAKSVEGVQVIVNDVDVNSDQNTKNDETQVHNDVTILSTLNGHVTSSATSTTTQLPVVQETKQHPKTEQVLIPGLTQSTVQTPVTQKTEEHPVPIVKDLITPVPITSTSHSSVAQETVKPPMEIGKENQVNPSLNGNHQIPLNPLFKDLTVGESNRKIEQVAKQNKA